MKGPIPEAALAQHIAVLGKTGAGKTYAARGIVETLLDKGLRVCIVDPTGAWHGLRSSASGKRAGYPVVIFGGTHADLPLGMAHGEALAEIIGTSSTPAIIDPSLMKISERTRFFADFADALVRKNKGPLHLVIDEAHLFAPQGKVSDPQSGAMLHAANNLVSLGRSRGLRIILITQRPAKLHKDSLTQVETLIAMRLIAPQDRHAVEEWIKDNADEKKGREIIESLATLKTGQGWVWAPEVGVLERVTFPKIHTFDSGRAPDGTEIAGQVLAPIDRDAIATKLKAVAADALANDPAALKKEIAQLRTAIAKAKPVQDGISQRETNEMVAAAKQVGDAVGYRRGRLSGLKDADNIMRSALNSAIAMESNELAPITTGHQPISAGDRVKVSGMKPKRLNGEMIVEAASTRAPRSNDVAVRGELSGPERRILDAIAWLNSIGVDPCEQTAVAFLADYTFGGGAFNNPRGRLKATGLVEYVGSDKIRLTDEGRVLAHVPSEPLTENELHLRVLGRLPGPERRLLTPLLDSYPEPMSSQDLAAKANYAHGAGAFNNPRGRLRSLGLIEYAQAGMIVASKTLFPNHP